ncbi:hypothetical protein B4U79_18860, partial [Dinothrombium tinctorium]
ENKRPLPAIVTQYYDSSTDGILVRDTTVLPIRVLVRIFQDEKRQNVRDYFIVNSHDFQLLSNVGEKEKIFDISNCFLDPGQSIWFRMKFIDYMNIVVLQEEKKLIENKFRDYLEQMGIPPTRLPVVIIDVSDTLVSVTAKLLQRAPFVLSFDKIPKKQINKNFGTTIIVDSEEKCGQSCYADDQCTGFSYCGNFECDRVYKNYSLSIDDNVDDNQYCNTYKRQDKTGRGRIQDGMIDELMLLIQDQVKNGKFVLSFGSGTEAFNLTCSEIKLNVEPGFSQEYEKMIGNPFASKPSSMDIANSFSKDYFVEFNKRNRRFDFSQIKRYLNEYNVIPGVEVQSSSIKDLKVSSEEECAKACSLESNCLSFDMCRDGWIQTCRLYAYHIFVTQDQKKHKFISEEN